MQHGINTKPNSRGKVVCSCVEDHKTIHAFL